MVIIIYNVVNLLVYLLEPKEKLDTLMNHQILKIPPILIDLEVIVCVITLLLNYVEEKMSSGVMFLTVAKEIRDARKEIYDNEKNMYMVFELYKQFFFSLLSRGAFAFQCYVVF